MTLHKMRLVCPGRGGRKESSQKMKPTFTRLNVAAVLALAIAALPAVSRATTLLPPGGCIGANCFTILGPIETVTATGAVVASTGLVSFNGVDALGHVFYTGQAQENVIQDSTTGDLDFIYQFATVSGADIANFSATNYAGFITNVGVGAVGSNLFTPPGGTVAPDPITRSPGMGTTLTFNFTANQVLAGEQTLELIAKTNAKYIVPAAFNFGDGGVATVVGFGPGVPEPATMALLGAGLLALGAAIRRQKK